MGIYVIDDLFYLCVGVSILLAFVNWRWALYACVILDVIRDPVRKLSSGHSVMITQAVNVIWVFIAIAVVSHERRRLLELVQKISATLHSCRAAVCCAVAWRNGVAGQVCRRLETGRYRCGHHIYS